MKKILAIFVLLAFVSFGFADAKNDDPIAEQLFAPEIVMKYQQEIGLDETQRNAIKEEIQKAQSKFLDLQWQAEAESRKLIQLLQAPSIDETRVLAQADKVMDLEQEVKKTHLSLLIRIRNSLTPKQQAKLMELKKSL